MHDFLIALAFVAMVTCPAIVGVLPQGEPDDEIEALPNCAAAYAASHTAGN